MHQRSTVQTSSKRRLVKRHEIALKWLLHVKEYYNFFYNDGNACDSIVLSDFSY